MKEFNSLEEAGKSIKSFSHADRELNIEISNPQFCLAIIKILARKYKVSDRLAAEALNTRQANSQLKLQNTLMKSIEVGPARLQRDRMDDITLGISEFFQDLKNKGADFNFSTYFNDRDKKYCTTPLQYALQLGKPLDLVSELLKQGADPQGPFFVSGSSISSIIETLQKDLSFQMKNPNYPSSFNYTNKGLISLMDMLKEAIVKK
jgi:hypothetical protein